MKKNILIAGLCTLALFGCNKNDDNEIVDFKTSEQQVLTHFVDGVAIPEYNDLTAKADALNASIVALSNSKTEANLTTARTSWVEMRKVWEQCEGFLFGPVEDNEYDPFMDTWPTDYVQMDSLLTSGNALTVNDIQNVTLSLRGFHPIEYIIFGADGHRTAASLTARQLDYLVSLSLDLRNNCHALSDSWTTGMYGDLVKTAGYGSSKYASRHELFLAMADGLIGIADEVGTGKIEEPFVSYDSTLVESPYSGNSMIDFRNNIVGLQNVYLGQYGASGKGLSFLVAANNQALDNKIRSQITTAIQSFDKITVSFEQAIFTQRPQIQQTQAALATLNITLENELKPYIIQYIKD